MPPKKPQLKPEAAKKQDIADEAPLQAVVLADSYNRRFEVLCSDKPRILLPLCSTPLLAWTLEALSASKVKQVFLFCGVHADLIRQYVESSPYRALLDIRCLSSQTARTPGDALRELDSMGVLNASNPFILVHSPLVANYDFSRMVDAHKRLREKDPNYIMTMGVGRGGRRHPESPIMLVHPPSSRLLHYHLQAMQPPSHRVELPATLFTDPFPATIDEYELWSGTSTSAAPGFRDLGVDICEADVPALCTENFDYHDLRRHFVQGVLTSELLGKNIAVHLVGEDKGDGKDERSGTGGTYVGRVRDTRTYSDISRDVMRRWAFPLTPDLSGLGSRGTDAGGSYELRRGNVYVAREDVKLSLSTTLRGPCVVGPYSTLGEQTLIYQSTLGAAAAIGRNTRITKSYIFDNVKIGAGCLLNQCIVGENVTIKDGVEIGTGALIGDGVTLGKGVRVPEFARIGREPWRPEGWEEGDEDEDEEDREKLRLEILGSDSIGHIWPQEEEEAGSDSEDEEEDPYEHPRNKRLLQLGRSLSNMSGSTDSLSTLSKASSSPASSPASYASDESLDLEVQGVSSLQLGPGSSAAFRAEAASTLQRAWDEGHATKNVEVEFGLLVPAFNAGVDAARQEVLRFFLGKVDAGEGATAGGVLKSATSIFARWGALASKYATSNPTGLVLDVQRYCVEEGGVAGMGKWFAVLLRAAYEADLVDEGTLIRWRGLEEAKKGDAGEGDEKVWGEMWKRGKVYVDVLEQMESDDDDDEEDDEEDGEEDSEEEESDED